MNILFFLIPLSIVLLSLAIWAFFWAVKNDQFEDLDGPAYSILYDDDLPPKKPQVTDEADEHTENPEKTDPEAATSKDRPSE